MGRRLTTGARYAEIPRSFSGCIYFAELTGGIVKVGYSQNPRSRIQALSCQTKRLMGADLLRFHVGPDLGKRQAQELECRLIDALNAIGSALPGRREYFTGISFDDAVSLTAPRPHTRPTSSGAAVAAHQGIVGGNPRGGCVGHASTVLFFAQINNA